jgi:hypothetical protein
MKIPNQHILNDEKIKKLVISGKRDILCYSEAVPMENSESQHGKTCMHGSMAPFGCADKSVEKH